MKEKLSVFIQALAFLILSNAALLLCVVFIRWDISAANISQWEAQFRLMLIIFNVVLLCLIAFAAGKPEGGNVTDD